MGVEGVIMDISNDYMINAINSSQQQTVKDNTVLTQQDFLKILAAEISNPSFSGESGSSGQSDFMGPMLQMNLIDQMTELNNAMQHTMVMSHQQQALSLVGKEVTVAGSGDELVTGIVEKVRFSDGFASLQIAGVEYNLSSIVEVGEAND